MNFAAYITALKGLLTRFQQLRPQSGLLISKVLFQRFEMGGVEAGQSLILRLGGWGYWTGAMQNFRECVLGELLRIHLPRRWVNKGKKKARVPYFGTPASFPPA
jgi:hypothetical protein